jgi:hypothetical protein
VRRRDYSDYDGDIKEEKEEKMEFPGVFTRSCQMGAERHESCRGRRHVSGLDHQDV